MSHVAARAGTPSDSTVVPVRQPSAKKGAEGDADADFGRHVDGLAGGRGSPGKAALATVVDRGPANPRWQPPIDTELRVPLPDAAAVVEMESVEADSPTVVEEPSDAIQPSGLSPLDPLLLASDVAAAAVASGAGAMGPAEPGASGPVGADNEVRPGTSSRLLSAMLTEAPDTAIALTEPDDLPRLELTMEAQETSRRGGDVRVVARETHLPPAALPLAMRSKPPGEDDTAHAPADPVADASGGRLGKGAVTRADAGAAIATAVEPAAQPKRASRDAEQGAAGSGQSPTRPIPGRLPATDDVRQAQTQTQAHAQIQTRAGDETSLDPAQRAQPVRTSGQDENPAPAQAAMPVTRQMVDGIASEIAPPPDAGGVGPSAAAAPTPLPRPVKVVTIELSPAELGTLTVRISLRNDALELQVEASRRETARMVDADRDTLSSLLRSAGYHVEAVTVRAVEQPAPAAVAGSAAGSQDGAPSPQSQSQSQSSGSQADQRSAGGRAHADGHRQGHGTRQDTRGDEGGFRPRAGGRYV